MAVTTFFNALAFILLSSVFCSNLVVTQQHECSYDYRNLTDSYEVDCDEVPMDEIQNSFNKTKPPIKIHSLTLWIRSSGDFIPADLLGESQLTDELWIRGSRRNQNYSLLEVDPNAFRSSLRNATLKRVTIGTYLEGIALDFSFLTGFDNIRDLYFLSIKHLNPTSLPTLPSLTNLIFSYIENLNSIALPALPKLTFLTFSYSTGLNEAFQDNSTFILETDRGLNYFGVYDCELDTNGLANLLDWVLPSSAETLKKLTISGNSITSTPVQLSSFRSIEHLSIENNQMLLNIGNNSIYYDHSKTPSYSTIIDMILSKIASVEPGAFQGNYSSAKVFLSGNFLTRFEEGAFKSMLEDMSSKDAKGFLDVGFNPFDCYSDQCQHLNWLIRDNRHLLDKLKYARCIYDKTPFKDLSQSLCDAYGITSTPEPEPTTTEEPDNSHSCAPQIPLITILFSSLITVSVSLIGALF